MPIDALKIASSVSDSMIISGAPFNINTEITNTYEDKVDILEIFYNIPYKVQWIHHKTYTEIYNSLANKNFITKFFSKPAWRKAAFPPGENMSYGNKENYEIGFRMLLPGEKWIYSFEAIVPKWLTATGSKITFTGYVIYRLKDEKHISNFEVSFIVRPPLIANTIGAALGGLLGTSALFLRKFTEEGDTALDFPFLSSSALAIILGIIMVVYSSRKSSDVQPILTVEDFWGGFIAGFLVGYLGHSFFSKVVTIAQ